MLRLGVIGLGNRINNVLKCLMETGQTKLIAVADIADKTKILEENNYHNVKIYCNAEDMLQQEKLDGVCIGTRCNLHASYMKIVERYGIPTFLEKPVGINDDDLAVLKSIKNMNHKVVVSFPLRVSPIVEYVKSLIDKGEIGEVMHIQAYNNVNYGRGYYHKWYRNEDITGGLFLQKATHDIDYINYLAGKCKPQSVCAMSSKTYYKGENPAGLKCDECEKRFNCEESIENLRKKNPDYEAEYDGEIMCCFAKDTGNQDSGSFIMNYDTGMHIVYSQNFIVKNTAGRRGACLIGQHGTIDMDFEKNLVVVHKHLENSMQEYKMPDIKGTHYGGDKSLAENFVNVMKGVEKSKTPLNDGILSAEICLYAKKSAAENKFYKIEL